MTESILSKVSRTLGRDKPPAYQKWLGHFDIVEALDKSEFCPICRLTFRAVESYLDSYLYEHVNDPHIRAMLRASRGFCADHVWRIVQSVTSNLGVAITYHDIIRSIGEAMREERDAARGAFRPGFRLPWARAKDIARAVGEFMDRVRGRRPCPACEYGRRVEEMYTFFALDLLDDEAVAPRLARRLCLRHFDLALRSVRCREHFDMLVGGQLAILDELEGELSEFIRKNDYRFQDEGFGEEADSWRRAPLHVASLPKSIEPKF